MARGFQFNGFQGPGFQQGSGGGGVQGEVTDINTPLSLTTIISWAGPVALAGLLGALVRRLLERW